MNETNAPLNYGKSTNFANEFLLPMGICRVNNSTHTIETRRLFPQSVTFFFRSSSRWYFRLLTRLPQLQLKDKRFPYKFTGRNCQASKFNQKKCTYIHVNCKYIHILFGNHFSLFGLQIFFIALVSYSKWIQNHVECK